jgi:hypothetical protein
MIGHHRSDYLGASAMVKPSSPTKVAYWSDVILAYRRSGLTQGGFRRENGVSYHSLRWWLRGLGAETAAAAHRRPKPRAATRKTAERDPIGFLPVRVVGAGADHSPGGVPGDAMSPIQVLLAGGRRVAVGAGFDPDTLHGVVAALEALGC